MNLVGGTDPARTRRGGGESGEIVIPSLFARELDALLVDLPFGDGQYGMQNLGPELVPDALDAAEASVSS